MKSDFFKLCQYKPCSKLFKFYYKSHSFRKFCSKKCHNLSMIGRKLITIHNKNCKCSFCYKLGKNNPHFGKRHSQALKKRYSLERQGKGNPFYGKKHSNEIKQFLKESQLQEKGNNWKGGITPLIILIRNMAEMNNWRVKIFIRDNRICQSCFKNDKNIEAHHKKPFIKILQEFLQQYSQFSPIEDKETLVRLAITYEPFWDLSNGETLCEVCHDLKSKGRLTNV